LARRPIGAAADGHARCDGGSSSERWSPSRRSGSEVFAQSGQTKVFATELQETKRVLMQATLREFSSIEIQPQVK
jgi:hypothetical protein